MADADGRLELNIAGGARICVPLSLDQITPYVLLEQEDWFEDEIRFVRRWLKPGMRAVDVGANFGVYTISMARLVGAEGRVWAFEPTPATGDYLRQSIDLNGLHSVELYHAAVSDQDGSVSFSLGAHSELNSVAAVGAPGNLIEVRAVTLDRMAAECDWGAVDFVKLDVEGHESEAVQGGRNFFSACSPLIMLEITNRPERAVLLLEELGYTYYRLLPGALTLAPFDPAEPDGGYLLNLFACKDDRASRLADAGLLARSSGAEVAAPEPSAWTAYARNAPYSHSMAERWPEKAGFFSSADRRTYLQGLAAFAASRRADCGPEERLALLKFAYQCVAKALDATETPARRISLARLAWELGWRDIAVDVLLTSAQRVAADAQRILAEPFLAPSARHERLAVGPSQEAWLTCAVIEQCEKLRGYSSLYTGTESHLLLEPLRNLEMRSAEMDRRWELVRLKHRMRSAGWPTGALRVLSEENLNPQFWSGPAIAALEAGGPR